MSAFKYLIKRDRQDLLLHSPVSPYAISAPLLSRSLGHSCPFEAHKTSEAGTLSRSLGRYENSPRNFYTSSIAIPSGHGFVRDGALSEGLGKSTTEEEEPGEFPPRMLHGSRTDSMSDHALSGASIDSNDGALFPSLDAGLNETDIDWLPPELWTDYEGDEGDEKECNDTTEQQEQVDDSEERYMGDVLRLLLSDSPTLRMIDSQTTQVHISSATDCPSASGGDMNKVVMEDSGPTEEESLVVVKSSPVTSKKPTTHRF